MCIFDGVVNIPVGRTNVLDFHYSYYIADICYFMDISDLSFVISSIIAYRKCASKICRLVSHPSGTSMMK